jgi:hypothetical protein
MLRRLLPPLALFLALLLLAGLAGFGLGQLRARLTPPPAAVDLLVYGATPQGVSTAVAAARAGLKVRLVTPDPAVGGVLTQSGLATLDLSRSFSDRSLQNGLFAEFWQRLGHSDASFDSQEASQVLTRLLAEAGVELQLNTQLKQVEVDDNKIAAVFLQAQGQPKAPALGWRVPYLVDASDTAELAALAGAAFSLGREDTALRPVNSAISTVSSAINNSTPQDQRQMAATLVLRLGGLDWSRLCARLRRDARDRRHPSGCSSATGWGLWSRAERYQASDPTRFDLRGLNLARQSDDSVLVNALQIFGVDGRDQAAVAKAKQDGQREARRVVEFLRRTEPVFAQAQLLGVAPQLYIRESRHLLGLYRLRADDVLLGRVFADTIAFGSYPLDGQAYIAGEPFYILGTPAAFGVPFRSLVPQKLRNLLVVSQAAAFDSVAAFSARVAPLQMALGQAAGLASAIATTYQLDYHTLAASPRQIERLRIRLGSEGAWLGPDFVGFLRWDKPANPQTEAIAVALLRKGLWITPYHLRGGLFLDQPIQKGDFLGNLEHFYYAQRNNQTALAWLAALRLRWPPLTPLKHHELRQALAGLGVVLAEKSPQPAQQNVKRGEAAVALWQLIHSPGLGPKVNP